MLTTATVDDINDDDDHDLLLPDYYPDSLTSSFSRSDDDSCST